MKTTIKVKECDCRNKNIFTNCYDGYLQQDGSPLPKIGELYFNCVKCKISFIGLTVFCHCSPKYKIREFKLKSIEIKTILSLTKEESYLLPDNEWVEDDKVAVLTWE